jgi:hypothetical protein
VGSGPELAYHKDKRPGVLALLPAGPAATAAATTAITAAAAAHKAAQCHASSSFAPIALQQCEGLRATSAATAAACAQACCDQGPACDTWMWSAAAAAAANGQPCWTGKSTRCVPSAAWSGGKRLPPAPTPAPKPTPDPGVAGTCVCPQAPKPFGQADGQLVYHAVANQSADTGTGAVGFRAGKCKPFPATVLNEQRNPTCDVRAYAGGQWACHHKWSLLDADQEIPWTDQPLVFHHKCVQVLTALVQIRESENGLS